MNTRIKLYVLIDKISLLTSLTVSFNNLKIMINYEFINNMSHTHFVYVHRPKSKMSPILFNVPEQQYYFSGYIQPSAGLQAGIKYEQCW